ncbi:uncharacterized protein B0T15DRAFT_490721 [Chaetomium strumarium]|uniref:Eisosome protein 1 protein n=1 Tax=Chaetomium strumarium TaxID=1170767 RepID=A0AAJ0GXU3_9PEZI|nr:hypothetical protein B0T15DRAFT_490721 [Chaetomium strumarium]
MASAAAMLGWASSPASPASSPTEPGSFPAPPSAAPRSQDARLAAGCAQLHPKQPSSPPSLWVSTAANLAFRASKTPPPNAEQLAFSRQDSAHAAKGVMANSRPRPRARSTPQTPTEKNADPFNAGSDALSAATIAHGRSARSSTISAGEAGAVPYTTMNRQMFTSHPPVRPEIDEKNRAEVLHASAIAMAKKMYDQQQKMIDSSARARGHARTSSLPGGPVDSESLSSARNEEQAPMAYGSLQEAAYRLAQERLAKLQEEHQKQRGLQDRYAESAAPPHRSRFGSIKSKLTRKRSSSDGDLPGEDRQRSEQIRRQMSLLNNRLSEVDGEKRARDRKALLAAAQRNVKAQLHAMDAKVQSDTGRVPQITMDDWGRKALVAARARFDASNETAGKVDLGGGKFMDRSEVERIAAGRIQPLLDEINEKAEKEQERQAEERLEEERQKEEAERDRMREKEIQEIHKKLKEQQKQDEKAREAEIKQKEKIRKDEERAAKAEQKQAAKLEEGKEEEEEKEGLPRSTTGQTEAVDQGQLQPTAESKPSTSARHVRALSIRFPKRPSRTPKALVDTAVEGQQPSSADESTSPKQKVRAWLLSRFPRPRAKSAGTAPAAEQAARDSNPPTKRGFIGGVALARLRRDNASTPSVVERQEQGTGAGSGADKTAENDSASSTRRDSSMCEVAMAGRRTTTKGADEPGESSVATATTASARVTVPSTPPQRPVSQVSQASVPISVSEQPSVSSLRSSSARRSSSSSNSGSGSGEDKFVEARSEPETTRSKNLTPPRVLGAGQGMAGKASPFRESRFSEILE